MSPWWQMAKMSRVTPSGSASSSGKIFCSCAAPFAAEIPIGGDGSTAPLLATQEPFALLFPENAWPLSSVANPISN